MTERDQAIKHSPNGSSGLPERLAGFDHFTTAEDQPADVATGLVSLGYITAAIRRSARFWCALAIVGMLVGLGVCVKSPPAYKASTSVLLTYGPDDSPTSAVLDNQAIAESHAVAQLAMRKLGLQQSVGSFAAAYTVAVVTNRVLLITVSAPSSSASVRRANAVAARSCSCGRRRCKPRRNKCSAPSIRKSARPGRTLRPSPRRSARCPRSRAPPLSGRT